MASPFANIATKQPKAGSRYDDTWLQMLEEARSGPDTITRDIMPESQPSTDVVDPNSPIDPVVLAKEFLARGSMPWSTPESMEYARNEEANRFRENKALLAKEEAERPWEWRDVTQPLAEIGTAAQLASVPASFIPGIGPAAGGVLAAGGTALTTPEMIRHGYENPTEGLTPLQGGMAAIGLAPSLGAFRRSLAARNIASPPSQGAHLPFKPRAPRPVGAKVDLPEGPYRAENPAFRKMAETDLSPEGPDLWFGGDRTTGFRGYPADSPLPKPSEDAWSALKTLATRKEVAAKRPFQSTVDMAQGWRPTDVDEAAALLRPSRTAGDLTDLSAVLDDVALQPQAPDMASRAAERFGRSFRSETGGAGTRQPFAPEARSSWQALAHPKPRRVSKGVPTHSGGDKVFEGKVSKARAMKEYAKGKK